MGVSGKPACPSAAWDLWTQKETIAWLWEIDRLEENSLLSQMGGKSVQAPAAAFPRGHGAGVEISFVVSHQQASLTYVS